MLAQEVQEGVAVDERDFRYLEKEDIYREEEAIFCGADCGGAEAGRGGGADWGTGTAGRDLGTEVLSLKKQYAKLEIDPVRQLKPLQEENQRLKRLVADLTLDKTMLQGRSLTR